MSKVDTNKLIIVGNLTKDPEGGIAGETQYLGFSIANNQNKNVNFFDVVTFGKLAEICGKYLQKGKQVVIEGKLRQKKWKNKSGENRYKIDIIADAVQFLGNSNQEQGFYNIQEDDDPFSDGNLG